MDKIKDYRQFAEECLETAKSAKPRELREHYLTLAASWDRLAQERRKFLNEVTKLNPDRRA